MFEANKTKLWIGAQIDRNGSSYPVVQLIGNGSYSAELDTSFEVSKTR